MKFCYDTRFTFLNNPKYLDPSFKTDLDFFILFRKENIQSCERRNTVYEMSNPRPFIAAQEFTNRGNNSVIKSRFISPLSKYFTHQILFPYQNQFLGEIVKKLVQHQYQFH